MKDRNGRTYAKLSDCRLGTKLEADGGFTCLLKGSIVTIRFDSGFPYFECISGRHYLSGQVDGEYLIGLYLA
jgi:hypothetical protein